MSDNTVNVVLFSGGRGSSVLTKQLLNHTNVSLSLIVNGYDDGLSTGEVRRFLGDCLGPSDFRKNASRIAVLKRSCESALITLLDLRYPVEVNIDLIDSTLDLLTGKNAHNEGDFFVDFKSLYEQVGASSKQRLSARMQAFRDELATRSTAQSPGFDFSDCSIGKSGFCGQFSGERKRL